ncbi:MAG TPA: SDR family oxidoreductase [Vicinamibacterales bacterium]|nr:SDR family oxidoreductase [Vicinamibacterales bacterium]
MSRAEKRTVLVTGAGGYIGATLVDQLLAAGHRVIGLDRYFFGESLLGDTLLNPNFELRRKDVREVEASDFDGVDAVCDLAALSNDPAGALDQDLTYSINHQARVRSAEMAKGAGVKRYVLASSCSVYGAGDGRPLTEESATQPISTYAMANLKAEADLLPMNDSKFAVTAFRQATVFGLSKRMRFDLVVNLMTINAVQKGKIFVMGGGKQWRPIVHVADTASAFVSVLERAPSEVGGRVFNIGSSEHNYQVLSLAYIVRENIPFPIELDVVPDDSDARNYNVSFTRAEKELGLKPLRSPADGAREIYEALKLGRTDTGIKTVTVKWYQHIIDAKRLVDELSIGGRLL